MDVVTSLEEKLTECKHSFVNALHINELSLKFPI